MYDSLWENEYRNIITPIPTINIFSRSILPSSQIVDDFQSIDIFGGLIYHLEV